MAGMMDRRRMLGVSAGAAAATVVGAATAGQAAATPGHRLPPVPGMKGDRVANEFWYAFDQATWHEASQEFKDAWAAVKAYFDGGDAELAMVLAWMEDMQSPSYPAGYVNLVKPIKEPLRVVSRIQLEVFDRFYPLHHPHSRDRLASAFADFGQGVLYDPRIEGVHSMNGQPAPAGYHIWHAILRAQTFLGIDAWKWQIIDPMVGLGWGLQSIAKPSQKEWNPPLPRHVVREQSRKWLRRSPRELDRAFLSQPYPEDNPGGNPAETQAQLFTGKTVR
ncbi:MULTISPECIES: hypothetical protein [Nonomuraea]|jgi:hypothetical protein|uniref:Uncharacterized protein n=1 Tax=Nonomuraea salmonea TaxID=46181 RepID=A0ABV5NE58_9ACTN